MNCEAVAQELSAYIDGELPAAEAQALAAHLAQCEHCRNELAELKRVADLIRVLPAKKAPAGFANDVTAEIESRRKTREKVGYYLRVSGWAAAAAMVAVALSVLYREQEAGKQAGAEYVVAKALALDRRLVENASAATAMRAAPLVGDKELPMKSTVASQKLDEAKDQKQALGARAKEAPAAVAAPVPAMAKASATNGLTAFRFDSSGPLAESVILRVKQPAEAAVKVKALFARMEIGKRSAELEGQIAAGAPRATELYASSVGTSRASQQAYSAEARSPEAGKLSAAKAGSAASPFDVARHTEGGQALRPERIEGQRSIGVAAEMTEKLAFEPIVANIRSDQYQNMLAELAKLGKLETPVAADKLAREAAPAAGAERRKARAAPIEKQLREAEAEKSATVENVQASAVPSPHEQGAMLRLTVTIKPLARAEPEAPK